MVSLRASGAEEHCAELLTWNHQLARLLQSCDGCDQSSSQWGMRKSMVEPCRLRRQSQRQRGMRKSMVAPLQTEGVRS